MLRDAVRAVLLGGLHRLCAKDCRSMFLALYNIDVASRAKCAGFSPELNAPLRASDRDPRL
jgi:hypothetical protein